MPDAVNQQRTPFRIRIAATGETFEVPAEKSILFVLIENGYRVPSSCSDGRCGTCRTRYLGGEPEHRDSVLSEVERDDYLTVCVSRARSAELVLDVPPPGSEAALAPDGNVAMVDVSICVACLTCVRACTFGAARIDAALIGVGGIMGAARIDTGACTGCGLCVAACPTGAISMREFADGEVFARLDSLLPRSEQVPSDTRPHVVAFCCPSAAPSALAHCESGTDAGQVRVDLVPMPCTGRIDNLHIMRAFENGADGVIAAGCETSRCLFAAGSLNAARRVDRVAAWLDDVGLAAQRVQMALLPERDTGQFAQSLEALCRQLEALGPNPLRATKPGRKQHDGENTAP